MAELVTLKAERAKLQDKADKLHDRADKLQEKEDKLEAKEQSIMNLIAKKESPNEDHSSLLVIDRNHSLIYEDYTVEKLQGELAKVRGEVTYVRGELSKVTDCILELYKVITAYTMKLLDGIERSNEVVPSPSASDQPSFIRQIFLPCSPSTMGDLNHAKIAFEDGTYTCCRAQRPVLRAEMVCPAFGVFMDTFANVSVDSLFLRDDAMHLRDLARQAVPYLCEVLDNEAIKKSRTKKLLELVFATADEVDGWTRDSLQPEVDSVDLSARIAVGYDEYCLCFIEWKSETGSSGTVALSQLLSYVRDAAFENPQPSTSKKNTQSGGAESASALSGQDSLSNGDSSGGGESETTPLSLIEMEMNDTYRRATVAGDVCPSLGLVCHDTSIFAYAIWFEEGKISCVPLCQADVSILPNGNKLSELARFLFAYKDCLQYLRRHYESLGQYYSQDQKVSSAVVPAYTFSSSFYLPFRSSGRRCLGGDLGVQFHRNWSIQLTGTVDNRKRRKIVFGTLEVALDKPGELLDSTALGELKGQGQVAPKESAARLQTPWRILYEAPDDVLKASVPVMVKCVSSHAYPWGLHLLAGEKGLSPRLYLAVQLPGEITVVVMEELRSEDGWRLLGDAKVHKSSWKEAVTEAYKEFSRLTTTEKDQVVVHGDLRSVNIMVQVEKDGGVVETTKSRVRLIDLDWAGLQGTVCYPVDINVDLFQQVVKEIKPYAKIMRTHDVALLTKLFS